MKIPKNHSTSCRSAEHLHPDLPQYDTECPRCAALLDNEEPGRVEHRTRAEVARQEHADLRTRFAVALAPAVAQVVGIGLGAEVATTSYRLADALAHEDARRRAEDEKGGA